MADDPGKSTADGPRPDTAETTHAPGDGASSGGMGPAPQGIPVPVPWYRRPLFWGIVLSLLILALLLVWCAALIAADLWAGKRRQKALDACPPCLRSQL